MSTQHDLRDVAQYLEDLASTGWDGLRPSMMWTKTGARAATAARALWMKYVKERAVSSSAKATIARLQAELDAERETNQRLTDELEKR